MHVSVRLHPTPPHSNTAALHFTHTSLRNEWIQELVCICWDHECFYSSNWRDQTCNALRPHVASSSFALPDWTQVNRLNKTLWWSEGEGERLSGSWVKAKAQATQDWSWGAAAREGRSIIRRHWHTVMSPCCYWNTVHTEELAALLSGFQRFLSYCPLPVSASYATLDFMRFC